MKIHLAIISKKQIVRKKKEINEEHNEVVSTLETPLSYSGSRCRDGSGRKALFWEPRGLAIRALPNATEELYVADSRNNVIRKVVIRYGNRKAEKLSGKTN
mmetsp:Transcript_13442/g.18593  ORF Transcript_13442/g.18593 Transcript_13442/m.18593 type:complete len:101 (-) Transcript_13442:427-729(-)